MLTGGVPRSATRRRAWPSAINCLAVFRGGVSPGAATRRGSAKLILIEIQAWLSLIMLGGDFWRLLCGNSTLRAIAWSSGPGRPGGPVLLRQKVGSAAVCVCFAEVIIDLESVRSGSGRKSATRRRAWPSSMNWLPDVSRGGQSRGRNATKRRVFNLLWSKRLCFTLFCSGAKFAEP